MTCAVKCFSRRASPRSIFIHACPGSSDCQSRKEEEERKKERQKRQKEGRRHEKKKKERKKERNPFFDQTIHHRSCWKLTGIGVAVRRGEKVFVVALPASAGKRAEKAVAAFAKNAHKVVHIVPGKEAGEERKKTKKEQRKRKRTMNVHGFQ